jgi:hypothetical protein
MRIVESVITVPAFAAVTWPSDFAVIHSVSPASPSFALAFVPPSMMPPSASKAMLSLSPPPYS